MNPSPSFKAALSSIFIILIISAGGLHPRSAEPSKAEIIQKAWKAMFGGVKNEDIKSLYVESYFHGSTIPSRQTVKRPNLFRNEVSSGVLVFDGKRAAWVERKPDENGKPLSPELLDPAHWRHFEVDIALIVPAFFDYPSEYLGKEAVEGAETYKIRVNLPLGSNVIYFVDAKSFLILKRLVGWDGGSPTVYWENTMTGHKPYDGIVFPEGCSYPGRDGRETGTYQNVRINVDPPDELFRIPVALGR
jgi:hypothetical protein